MNGHPLAEPLDEEAAFQFMYDLVRGRVTAPDIAERLRSSPPEPARSGAVPDRSRTPAPGPGYWRTRFGAPSRSTNFWIFPVAVFGSSVTNVTPRGALK